MLPPPSGSQSTASTVGTFRSFTQPHPKRAGHRAEDPPSVHRRRCLPSNAGCDAPPRRRAEPIRPCVAPVVFQTGEPHIQVPRPAELCSAWQVHGTLPFKRFARTDVALYDCQGISDIVSGAGFEQTRATDHSAQHKYGPTPATEHALVSGLEFCGIRPDCSNSRAAQSGSALRKERLRC